jgi:hypothetical protein
MRWATCLRGARLPLSAIQIPAIRSPAGAPVDGGSGRLRTAPRTPGKAPEWNLLPSEIQWESAGAEFFLAGTPQS